MGIHYNHKSKEGDRKMQKELKRKMRQETRKQKKMGKTKNRSKDKKQNRHKAKQKLQKRARAGEGPSLVEAKTYRFYGHSRREEKFGTYRSEAEWNDWRERDPLTVAERVLEISPEEKEEHFRAVEAELAEAVEFADASPAPKIEDAYEDLYA